MKRKWAKKVKADTASKVKRQSTTGAAAIGLIISMGASNLILTKPGDSAPAADALVQEAALSSSPARTEAGQVSYANLVEPTTESFSILITPTPLVQLQEAVAELAPSAIEQPEQTRQTLAPTALAKRVDATSMLTDAKTGATLPRRDAAILNRNIPGQTEAQTRNLLLVLRVNRLISQLKHSQTVAIYSKSEEVNRSHKVSAFAGTAEESLLAISEDKSTWSAKQSLLIDRLKQNRSQDTLAKWRSHESKNSSVALTQGTKTVSFREKGTQAQTAASLGLLPRGTPAASTQLNSQQLPQQPATVYVIPPITPNLLATSNSLKFEQERSLLPFQAIVLGSNQLEIGVNSSNGVIPADSQDYRVKAGDTLSAIALRQKMPLVALIKANHLDDPNRLQINQRLIIPVERSNNSVALNIGRIETPNSFLPVTPALNPTYSGMGGEISDDDSVSASPPPNVEEIQQVQSAAAQQELLGDRYVENLRTDIQKLQQKYHQGLLTAQAKPDANQTSTTPVTAANATKQLQPQILAQSAVNQPINPEFTAERAAKTLQLDRQKQLPVPLRTAGRTVRVRNGVATAPLGADAVDSLRSFQEQNVSPALPPLGGVDNYLPNPTSISAKGLIWPARGKLTSGYGWRWGRMHKGVDIAAPIGTPIMAAAPGVVVKAGWNSGGYGNLVDIQHTDGTVTRYGHNKRILVQAGQIVQQGQQISEMGSTGFSTGPHLHFEVHPMGKKAVNPIAYLPR